MVSAHGDPESCIEGLGHGADDYVGKPFPPRELVARIHAVLRRRIGFGEPLPLSTVCGLRHDAMMRKLTAEDGPVIGLSHQENRIVAALIESAGAVVSRDVLLDYLHAHGAETCDRSVDAVISKLRSKPLERRHIIRTVRGEGYRLATGTLGDQ